VRSEL